MINNIRTNLSGMILILFQVYFPIKPYSCKDDDKSGIKDKDDEKYERVGE
jgi:hypothetical protein